MKNSMRRVAYFNKIILTLHLVSFTPFKTVYHKMKTRYIFLLLLPAFLLPVEARTRTVIKDTLPQAGSLLVKAYTDSIVSYKAVLDSLSALKIERMDYPATDARFFRVFTPATFYHSIAVRKMGLKDDGGNGDDAIGGEIDNALLYLYLHRPDLVVNSEKRLDDAARVKKEIDAPIRNKVEYMEKSSPLPDEKLDMPVEVVVYKPDFWTFAGDYYLQFLQNYVSGNWYKGGESNYSMVASAMLQANYNNKQKVKLDNKLEMKLGFQTSRSDSLHSFKTSEDLIRYTGKLGLQASKKWYYTLQLIASTQFMRGYKSNDKFVYSDILSPLNINISIGMDYNVSAFKKKLTGNVQLAPLAYNFRYVGREALATRYGLDEGRHTKNDFGSEMTVDLTWKFSEMIRWKTRLYAYTTYERAEVEWENTITFQFSKYISSNFFIYPRFDDGVARDGHHGYLQLKEYASIGFAFSF